MTKSTEGLSQHVTAGQLLAAAREASALTQAEIAKQMRLSLQTIKDIELDDYKHIGVLTFVRGYLCTYARLVGVSEAQVMTALETSGLMPKPEKYILSHDTVPTLGAVQTMQRRMIRWVSVGVAAFLVLLIALWWHAQKNSSHVSAAHTLLLVQKESEKKLILPKNLIKTVLHKKVLHKKMLHKKVLHKKVEGIKPIYKNVTYKIYPASAD